MFAKNVNPVLKALFPYKAPPPLIRNRLIDGIHIFSKHFHFLNIGLKKLSSII